MSSIYIISSIIYRNKNIFSNRNWAVAQAAVAELKREGFDERDISVLYTDAGHTIQAGLINGAVWGGVLGALVGLLFPPAGLLVTAGPIWGYFFRGWDWRCRGSHGGCSGRDHQRPDSPGDASRDGHASRRTGA